MSLTFKDCLANDLSATFFNLNEFAEAFTLTRGVLTTTGIAAIKESREYELGDDSGDSSFNNNLKTSWQSWDFDVPASEYKVSGVAVEPKKGDRWTDANGVVFIVEPRPKKQCFEPTGGDGLVIRVHTKRVS